MQRDSSNRRSEPSDFLLIRPAAAFLSLGMVLPEYLVVLALSAFLPMLVLAIIRLASPIVQTPFLRSVSEQTVSAKSTAF